MMFMMCIMLRLRREISFKGHDGRRMRRMRRRIERGYKYK